MRYFFSKTLVRSVENIVTDQKTPGRTFSSPNGFLLCVLYPVLFEFYQGQLRSTRAHV